MRTTLPLAIVSAVLLASCVDTTGISPESSKTPHPDTNANAAVTVVEYGDIQCPACQAAHAGATQPLIEKYGKQISFEFKHFPLRAIHRFAMDAAEAAECAADQKKYWEYLDIAYENQENLNRAALDDWAQRLGLDMELFGRCLKSGIKADAVLADYDEGEKLGVQGTPTFFVNGKKTNASELQPAVAEVLKNVGRNL